MADPKFQMDVQFFARAEEEGRTEEPTPRRKGKAESEGSFPRTRDLPAPLAILFVAILLRHTVPEMINTLKDFTALFLSGAYSVDDPTILSITHLATLAILAVIKLTLPAMLLAALCYIVADVVQIGFHFNWSFIKFNPGALIPDFTRVFRRFLPQRETMIELIKSVLKISVVGGVGIFIFWDNYGFMIETVRMGLYDGLARVGLVAYKIIIWTSVLLIVLSIPDYFYQRFEYTDKLKMRREEVRDEHKAMEGDPRIKSAQRKRMQEMIQRRMMQKVPKADVVITNPTHFAVALKYDHEERAAPICLAKGQDYIALRIRDIAEKHGVPIYEDKFLARALYDAVDIGEEIPPQFYEAVANVLAFVYRLRAGAAV